MSEEEMVKRLLTIGYSKDHLQLSLTRFTFSYNERFDLCGWGPLGGGDLVEVTFLYIKPLYFHSL